MEDHPRNDVDEVQRGFWLLNGLFLIELLPAFIELLISLENWRRRLKLAEALSRVCKLSVDALTHHHPVRLRFKSPLEGVTGRWPLEGNPWNLNAIVPKAIPLV